MTRTALMKHINDLMTSRGCSLTEDQDAVLCAALGALWEEINAPDATRLDVFVPDYDWNAKWGSPQEAVEAGLSVGDFSEGDQFQLLRLTAGALTTYRIADRKAIPVAVAFPIGLEDLEERG